MDQHRTPLFTGVLEHTSKQPLQFHIPGHKQGKGMDEEFKTFIGESALSIDLINIEPLDDLHNPRGILKEAQELAADAFGADFTFFSVQGTSGAIMTMVLSVCCPGDKIVVPRNVHKSVTSAIIFAGATPIFIHPELDHQHGISHGITPEAVANACEAHPDAKAVLVINPTYFGIAADLKQIVTIAHQYAIPVLVDEAHGVHIHFHEDLPLSAMQAGADMAATSVHKLGGSLTQSSVLNLNEGLVNRERVQSVISMITTTSTSYLLLSSLDTARRQLALEGRAQIGHTIHMADHARKEINRIPRLFCAGSEILSNGATFDWDPTKLIISVKELGISGHDAELWLRHHHRIEVELSDLYNILCLITPADRESDVKRLIHALKEMEEKHSPETCVYNMAVEVPEIPVLALTPRDAFYADTEIVGYHQAIGRISAEFIMIYPPGIPVFLPGEIITQENLDYIDKNLAAGLPVQGPEDESLQTLRVIKEHRAFQ
ncbi:aminotransferase class I/II-fold pyridoxal phosphate-dependent enzyme [Thalassobacillus sp. CUG 92003]|uniref:aminotransferase class I/II-fold pyridoxal phosphate-dependent enzyme n=1 Tax=Thalassobacillus sp. CUG 92003 TaxID=2736641 RepID=UPI0015E79EEC|nr:aminotransferase class I/II-fold pyridoxal phosphate-dependent enzyme [Thalassobacillus sp. CUG 92003]